MTENQPKYLHLPLPELKVGVFIRRRRNRLVFKVIGERPGSWLMKNMDTGAHRWVDETAIERNYEGW